MLQTTNVARYAKQDLKMKIHVHVQNQITVQNKEDLIKYSTLNPPQIMVLSQYTREDKARLCFKIFFFM